MKHLFPKLKFLFLIPLVFLLANCKRHITTVHEESFDDLRAVITINEKNILINGSGKEIMTFPDSTYLYFGFNVFVNHLPFKGTLIPFLDSKRNMGYMNKYGEIKSLIKRADYLDVFSNNFAVISVDNKFGYIDSLFQIKIETKYRAAGDFSCNRAFVSDNLYKWAIINMEGKQITSFIFDSMFESFSPDGVQTVSVNKKYGVIDTNGTFIVEPQYDYMATYREGWALVEHQDSVFYINTKGKKVLDVEADHAGSFHDGLAWINVGGERSWVTLGVTEGLWGAINKKGEIIISPKYSFIGNFNSGIAPFKRNDKYGIIDTDENIILPPTYRLITSFKHQRATVYDENACGVINQKGEIIVPIKCTNVSPYIYIN